MCWQHRIYALAMLAVALLLMGWIGILVGPVIVGLWAFVFYSHSRPAALRTICIVGFILLLLLALLSPAVSTSRHAARRSACRNNLKNILLALHNYHDAHGAFPPPYIADNEGRPMHSWRVLILPYLDQNALYKQYRFDEPWDSETNSQLLGKMPREYGCPSHRDSTSSRSMTSYVAVVDPRTCWPTTGERQFRDMLDGSSYTLLLVECNAKNILWTEPRDLELQAAIDVLSSTDPQTAGSHRREDFFYKYFDGRNVGCVDGSTRFLPPGLSRSVAESLLLIDDGPLNIDDSTESTRSYPREQLKTGNVWRAALFVFLVILPLPWVFLTPRPLESKVG